MSCRCHCRNIPIIPPSNIKAKELVIVIKYDNCQPIKHIVGVMDWDYHYDYHVFFSSSLQGHGSWHTLM
jgi:hypothetical protein